MAFGTWRLELSPSFDSVRPTYDIGRLFTGGGRQDEQDGAGGGERICRGAHGQGLAGAGGEHPGGGVWVADADSRVGRHYHAGAAHADDSALGREFAAPD